MQKRFFIEKKDLYELFINQNKTRNWIANFYGCSSVLIKKKCQEFGIKKSAVLVGKNLERKIKKKCLNCNKNFEVVQFRNSGKWEIKFCCHKCSSDYRYLGKKHKRKVANSVAARRRANMKNALVELTEEEKDIIRNMYINCPDGYEVDHIIPISKGGKHHPNNLQYLTMQENRKKHNKCSEQ